MLFDIVNLALRPLRLAGFPKKAPHKILKPKERETVKRL
jgi:hypothetical protein